MARRATVDFTICKACGICCSICPCSVFDLDERGYPGVARLADCTACFTCEWHCPDFAIELDYDDVPRSATSRRAAIGLPAAAGVALGERRNVSGEAYCGGEEDH